MNHFMNNGKEYLKKDRQYRSNQGRSPKQQQSNEIAAFVSIVGLIITFIIILLTSCSKEPAILDNCLEDKDPNMVCTMDVNYQCGCDGWIYINPCHATKNGVKRIKPDDPSYPDGYSGDGCQPW